MLKYSIDVILSTNCRVQNHISC